MMDSKHMQQKNTTHNVFMLDYGAELRTEYDFILLSYTRQWHFVDMKSRSIKHDYIDLTLILS